MTIPDRGSPPLLWGSSSGADGDDRGDDPHGEIVTSKLLENKGNDDGDDGGDHFSNVTGKRICAERFGTCDKDNRFRVVGTCPPGTRCMRCYSDASQVLKIVDAEVIGGGSEPLHRECAGPWFDHGDETGLADRAGGIESNPPARCAQCNGVPDGKERLRSIQGHMIWLHPECERHYIAEQKLPW